MGVGLLKIVLAVMEGGTLKNIYSVSRSWIGLIEGKL